MNNWLCINLDERQDRLEEITKHMNELNIKFQRIPAIKHNLGFVGCMKSHIKCLELAIEYNFPYVVIMEDDCEFLIKTDEINNYINEFLKCASPCFVFGGTLIKYEQYDNLFNRGKNIQTTTCYVIKNNYYKILLKLFNSNLYNLELTGLETEFAIDVVWKKLQELHIWLVPKKKVIQQRPGYSDIKKIYVDYTENFN